MKTILSRVALILILLLLPATVLPQCQSILCKSKTGDSCINDFPPFCRGSGCGMGMACLVFIGHCPTKQSSCYARICVETHYCPPNPQELVTPITLKSNELTLTYVGLPDGWTPLIDATGDYNNVAWLTSHPEFVRTEKFLERTVYVHQFTMDNGDVVERWYDPVVGAVPVRMTVAGLDGFNFMAQAIAIQ